MAKDELKWERELWSARGLWGRGWTIERMYLAISFVVMAIGIALLLMGSSTTCVCR